MENEKSIETPPAGGVKKILSGICHCCAYHHLFKIFSMRIRGEKCSEITKVGRNIALLGFFCPLFWIALFSGTRGSHLFFHATHSGIVFLIGVVIMIIGFKFQPYSSDE